MSAVPDLLRLKTIPVDLAQRIETDLLETSTFREGTPTTEGFARFDLQKKGFLHSHSKLFVSLIPQAGQPDSIIYPPNVGIGSVISRAVLKCNNQTLNEISDWNFLHAIKSAEIDNENNKEREQYTTGRMINHRFMYRKLNGAGTATERSDTNAVTYGLDNGRDYDVDSTFAKEGELAKPIPQLTLDATAVSESPVYSVDLSDLFPFLQTHSLPLYMIDQQMSIELYWSPTKSRVVLPSASVPVSGEDFKLDTQELKFCADYIFYEGDMMQRYAEANPVIEFSFPDYRLSKSTVTNVQLENGLVQNIGMANRLCSRVITAISPRQAAVSTESQKLLGQYEFDAPPIDANGDTGAIQYNVRYNDRFEFPTSITNKARLFTHYTKSVGLPFVTRQEYSTEGEQGLTAFFYNGRVQKTSLAGKFFFQGTKLTTGRVGVRGIELHFKGASIPAGDAYDVRAYVEYARMARLAGGDISVMNA